MSRRMRPSEPAGCAPRAGVFLLALLIAPVWLLAQQGSGTTESLVQNAKQPQKEQPKKQPPGAKGELPQFEIIPNEPPAKPEAEKPDAAKPAKPDPKAPAPRGKGTPKPEKPAKPEKPGKGFQPLPDDPNLPAGTCPTCLGTSFVPHTKRLPYVHVEGDRAPAPAMMVPWQFCPQCQADRDPAELAEQETTRLAEVGTAHAEWEKRMAMKLVRVETRHITLHCQMTPDVARRQGEAAEAAIAYIQSRTKSCFLTATRPQTYNFVYLWDKATYHKSIEICRNLPEFKQAQDWHLFPQLACFNGDGLTVGNAAEGKLAPPEHLVISQIALWNIGVANNGQGKDWLDVGFAYHTEYAVKNKVLMEYVKYQLNEARLGPNWASEAKKMAGANKLIRWRDLFDSDLVAWTPAHHVTAFATVSFLMRTDAVGFAKFNMLIGQGMTAPEALEKIYGRPIDQLEAMCGKWILQGA